MKVALRQDRTKLDAALAAAERSLYTYGHLGSTLTGTPRAGRKGASLELGAGEAAFDAARRGLQHWSAHRGIHAVIHPPDAPIAVGTTELVALRLGPVEVVVPTRVVEVIDEPRRYGFAYGTLEGHVERGEEGFLVEWRDDDRVVGEVRVDAVGATKLARMAEPVLGVGQRLAMRGYLRGMRRPVTG